MKNKLKVFIKQNGFLLFLFICVCVVAVGTVFIATQDLRTAEDLEEQELVILEEVKDEEVVDVDDLTLEDTEQVSSIGDTTEDEVATNEDIISEVDSTKVESDEMVEETIANEKEEIEYVEEYEEEDIELVTDKPITSILPVEGVILTEFNMEKLIYSETLSEWRMHSGIDIKAAEGTKVKAPLDGTIKEIIEDDLWGIIIVIDHGNGLETRFSNLGTKEMVKEGLLVSRGDYISTVGKTANIEMLMEPHLHYEAIKNGKIIDPRSITK